MQLGVTAVILADAYTTSKIQYASHLSESNAIGQKLLGTQPGTKETYMYLGTWMLTNYLISRALPAKWRPYWQGITIIGHGSAVINNCHAGLCDHSWNEPQWSQ